MAVGIIGWDAEGQPMYGDVGDNPAPAGAGQTQLDPRLTTPMSPIPGADPTGGGKYGSGSATSFPIASYTADPTWDYVHSTNGSANTILNGLNGLPASGVNAKGAIAQGQQWQEGAVDTLKAGGSQMGDELAGNLVGQRANTAGTNAQVNGIVGQSGQILGGLAAGSLAANATHNSEMDSLVAGLQPYQALGYDPEGHAAQTQALSNFSAIQGGSLDYQASQAQAAHARAVMAAVQQYNSNPNDVAQQQDAINQLKGAISGGEWAGNMRDVRDKYKSLSDPEITDQERFIMENLRQQSEARMRGNREALSSDLATRGIRSGASEAVGLGMENQETGNERVLTELGAGANAVNRSMQAMQGWAQTSEVGRQAELQAMGMYSDAAGNLRQMNDQVGEFNAAEQNQTNRVNATNATNVNISNAANDTNVSMFNAGQQNQAKANNQATRLAGAQGYSTAATNLRNSNETINMFNKDQEMVQSRHMDEVKYNASNSKLDGTNQTAGTVGHLVGQQTASAMDAAGSNWARNTRDNDTADANTRSKYGATKDFAGLGFDFGGSIMNGGIASHNIDMSDQGALTTGTVAAAGLKDNAVNHLIASQDKEAALAAVPKNDELSVLDFIPGGTAVSKLWNKVS
jgi:hypothetical protein